MKLIVKLDNGGSTEEFECHKDCDQCEVAWYCLTHSPLEFNRSHSVNGFFTKFNFCGVNYEFKDFSNKSLDSIVRNILGI
jgi:hypothetical protein